MIRDRRLDEIDFGSWQGRTKKEIALADPERYQRWLEDPTIGAPGGETVLDVAARVGAAADDLRARHKTGHVLVVAHKTILRVLITLLTGRDLRRYRELPQPVAALSVLDIDKNDVVVRVLADTSYLGRAAAETSVRAKASASGAVAAPSETPPQAAA